MTNGERRGAMMLCLSTLAVGLFDTLALALMMPLMALLVDPSILTTNVFAAQIHSFIGKPEYQNTVKLAGCISITLIVVSGVFSLLHQRRLNRFCADCQSRLGRDLLHGMVATSYVWFLERNSAALARVFTRDVLVWGREFLLKLLGSFRDITIIVLPTLLVLWVMPLGGVVLLALTGLLIWSLLKSIRPRLSRTVAAKQVADTVATKVAHEVLIGIKDIKVSSRGDFFVRIFGDAYSTYTSTQASAINWHQLPSASIMLIGQVAMVSIALVLWNSSAANSGELASQLGLLALVSSRVLPAANRISGSMTVLWSIWPAVKSIFELNEEVRAAQDVWSGNSRQVIKWHKLRFDHISYRYPTSHERALVGVSLEIERGKAYGLVGPSGAGKTTLVDVIMRLLTPTNGRILLDKLPLEEINRQSWQSKIGYVAQQPFMIDGTLRANVIFGIPDQHVDQKRVLMALETAQLGPFVSELPHGLDTIIGERGMRLSGGQRQRIAISRALYRDADLLILDEATSALDNVSERSIKDSIERLRGKITTLTIAHRLSTVRNCDRIFVIDGGRLVASGSYEELLVACQLFRSMVDSAEY